MDYKTKSVVHNFTLFNLKTQDGYCFIWHEAEGGLTANEFSSVLCSFLEDTVIPNLPNNNNYIIQRWMYRTELEFRPWQRFR